MLNEQTQLTGGWRAGELCGKKQFRGDLGRESKERKEGKRGEHEEEGAGTNDSNLKGEEQKGMKRLTEGKKTGKLENKSREIIRIQPSCLSPQQDSSSSLCVRYDLLPH